MASDQLIHSIACFAVSANLKEQIKLGLVTKALEPVEHVVRELAHRVEALGRRRVVLRRPVLQEKGVKDLVDRLVLALGERSGRALCLRVSRRLRLAHLLGDRFCLFAARGVEKRPELARGRVNVPFGQPPVVQQRAVRVAQKGGNARRVAEAGEEGPVARQAHPQLAHQAAGLRIRLQKAERRSGRA
eukprot:6206182-Pleurochrysis_carterae.AAC.1